MTPDQRLILMDRFLDAFAQSGIVLGGCRAAGIHRNLVAYWSEHDLHDFAKRYEQAKAEANDRIRAEIHRRAIQGVKRQEAIYYKGEVVGSKELTEYSDILLIFLAKSRMPEFRDKIGVETPSVTNAVIREIVVEMQIE